MQKTDEDRTAETRGQKTARRTVDAARQWFSKKGYTATRMDDIWQAAGVPSGSVYHAFNGGKLQIGEVVYKHWAEELRSAVEHVELKPVKPLPDFLSKRLLPAYCQWFTANRHRAAFMFEFEAVAADTTYRTGVNQARTDLQETLARVVAQAKGPWRHSRLPPAELEAIILGPVRLVIAGWILSNTGSTAPDRMIPILAKATSAALQTLYGSIDGPN